MITQTNSDRSLALITLIICYKNLHYIHHLYFHVFPYDHLIFICYYIITIKMVLLEFGEDIFRYVATIYDSYVPITYRTNEEEKEDQFRKLINETVHTPLKIQYYLWLWKIYSTYAVLKMFLLIPLELLIGIINSLLSIFNICFSKYTTFFSVITLAASYIFLQEQHTMFDPSYMYHLFRGQSTLKLYGLIFAIEVAEKILTKTGKYLYTQIKQKLEVPTVEVLFILPQITVCFLYTLIHTYIIFLEFNIYIVVINASMQNFIIFFFVTSLTKMKGGMFKKLDEKGYFSQINLDAKNRLQKIFYIILFQFSQFTRHIPDIQTKLFFIFIIGAVLEHMQHIAILIQSKQIDKVDNFRKKMFYKMYIRTDNQTFLKCLKNEFTVIPFTVFFIKEVYVIIYANYGINKSIILYSYIHLLAFLLIFKLCMIFIRKINLIFFPYTDEEIKELNHEEIHIKDSSQVKQGQKNKQKKD